MKKTFLKSLAGIAAVAFAVSCTAPAPKYKTVVVDAPFAMEPIKECVFPEQDFSIVDYGAVKGGETVNTEPSPKPSQLVIRPEEAVWLFLKGNG